MAITITDTGIFEGKPIRTPPWISPTVHGEPRLEQIFRLAQHAAFPHESLREEWERGTYGGGCTEPWIVEVVASLMKACEAKVVFEGGGFLGTTSAWLALTLEQMGGGKLIVAELDPQRAEATDWRLVSHRLEKVEHTVICDDVFNVIASLEDESIDFAWVDDCHEHAHVDKELGMLIPKMKVGGIITGHDVFGSCDLRQEFEKYGGYALDLPRLATAGGIGIIQVRS